MRVPVVASGGAGGPADIAEALEAGAQAALAASIFHDGEASMADVKQGWPRAACPSAREHPGRRPRAVRRPARRHRPRADARPHGCRGARRDRRDRLRPLPLPLARPALEEGRDVGQRPPGRLARARLRRRRHPHAGAAGRPDLPHGRRVVLRRRRSRPVRPGGDHRRARGLGRPRSYVAGLLAGAREGRQRKVGEEAIETVLAEPGATTSCRRSPTCGSTRWCCSMGTAATRSRRFGSSGAGAATPLCEPDEKPTGEPHVSLDTVRMLRYPCKRVPFVPPLSLFQGGRSRDR